ncbi:AMP-binding protein [Dactylosporangium matsuzakiense]|uniref:AMP-dependent acyl-CoA synthetase n=1 Tax=Dactylosporangium matsuzakiense TaxID=53360 RepID=A0A9W6KIF4_9ACTN|nr:AMP-binding protein [Dactylosporangium matsuzakiense]GLL02108.1 AMP-dependent acyl-CoA synthetase [Dactylosporangium matsuzakiense]
MNGSLVAPGARLIDAATGDVITGQALAAAVGAVAGTVAGIPAGAVLARTGLTVGAAVNYLGCWEAHRPVALLDPSLNPQTLAEMVRRFRPAAVTGLDEGSAGAHPGALPPGYDRRVLDMVGPAWVRRSDAPAPSRPSPDLGLMLATSGSTGDPKLVRLSRAAVVANAVAISEALHIDSSDVAPTSLPLFYSYGMSVLNSHLAAGATVVLVDGGVLSRGFWAAVDRYRATSLAGVPYHYEALARIRWSPAKHPSLRTLTQAGGRLRDETILAYHEKIQARGGRFYVMWGQTEAGPRMSILPADRLPEKVGSPGCALPGGRLSVLTGDGTETRRAGVEGEIVYRGPSVMMGYAETAADLSRGDDLNGVLATGDLGFLDEEGFVFLTGRLRRTGKIFGIRVNLDDIEKMVSRSAVNGARSVAVVPSESGVVVWCEGDLDAAGRGAITTLLAEQLQVHRSGLDCRAVEVMPLLSNGKIDYRALEAGS